ncbi:hypothetical protein [Glycomyces paridis]|uniref:hypothetical protein n=1 Tax=Glycomyces paridis TaxID=2126555 RepID=UPI0013052579|nr:hypothetical protein [Glycomyces paridis]
MHPRNVIAATVAVLLSSGCAAADEHTAEGPDGALGFLLHEDAVDYPGTWANYGSGLRDLVPLGDCVLGVGLYDNGYRDVGATWTGEADCTALRLHPEPDDGQGDPEGSQGWSGAPFGGATGVIDLGDGVMVGLSGESVQRRDADGTVTELADLDLPANAPKGEGGDRSGLCGLAAIPGGLLVSGFVNDDALLWTVADDGTVTEPATSEELTGEPEGFCRMASEGDTVVAFGADALAWRSLDGGRTWETAPAEGLPGDAWVLDLRPVDGAWRALAATPPGDGPLEVMQLDSADGLAWTVTGRQDVGDGKAVDVAFDAAGSPIIVGDRMVREDDRNSACNFVLTAAGRWPDLTWERGELGCAADPVLAVATLADGRVLIASNRHLWIRPA